MGSVKLERIEAEFENVLRSSCFVVGPPFSTCTLYIPRGPGERGGVEGTARRRGTWTWKGEVTWGRECQQHS